MDGSSRVSTYHATMAAKPELMSHWYCSIVPTLLCVGVFGREKGGRCRPPSNRACYPCVECLAWHRARGALAHLGLGLGIFRAARRRFNPDSSHNEKPARSDEPLVSLSALDGPCVDFNSPPIRRGIYETELCLRIVDPLDEQAAVGYTLRVVSDENDVARADLISG